MNSISPYTLSLLILIKHSFTNENQLISFILNRTESFDSIDEKDHQKEFENLLQNLDFSFSNQKPFANNDNENEFNFEINLANTYSVGFEALILNQLNNFKCPDDLITFFDSIKELIAKNIESQSLLGLFIRKCLISFEVGLFEGVSRTLEKVHLWSKKYVEKKKKKPIFSSQIKISKNSNLKSNQDEENYEENSKQTRQENQSDQYFVNFHKCIENRNIDESLYNLHKYFDTFMQNDSGNDKFKNMLPFTALNLARMHIEFGNLEEAKLALQETIKISQQQNDQECLVHSLKWFSYLFMELGNTKLAKRTLQKCIESSKEQNMDSVRQIGHLSLSEFAFFESPSAINEKSKNKNTPAIKLWRNLQNFFIAFNIPQSLVQRKISAESSDPLLMKTNANLIEAISWLYSGNVSLYLSAIESSIQILIQNAFSDEEENFTKDLDFFNENSDKENPIQNINSKLNIKSMFYQENLLLSFAQIAMLRIRQGLFHEVAKTISRLKKLINPEKMKPQSSKLFTLILGKILFEYYLYREDLISADLTAQKLLSLSKGFYTEADGSYAKHGFVVFLDALHLYSQVLLHQENLPQAHQLVLQLVKNCPKHFHFNLIEYYCTLSRIYSSSSKFIALLYILKAHSLCEKFKFYALKPQILLQLSLCLFQLDDPKQAFQILESNWPLILNSVSLLTKSHAQFLKAKIILTIYSKKIQLDPLLKESLLDLLRSSFSGFEKLHSLSNQKKSLHLLICTLHSFSKIQERNQLLQKWKKILLFEKEKQNNETQVQIIQNLSIQEQFELESQYFK
ncbi:anaphase-promoting complex subunit 5 [Anaeramoeba ignava]|uniref:Anaphase-promoting complex subunit 5 n=1 Tax=Anaeramoeba ignava TaxID=1746090 RepID=A0A9Q0LV40_ANAIG|nr:anaphase-promoting complex subunit 5 [Anaeramoeba ignava]